MGVGPAMGSPALGRSLRQGGGVKGEHRRCRGIGTKVEELQGRERERPTLGNELQLTRGSFVDSYSECPKELKTVHRLKSIRWVEMCV